MKRRFFNTLVCSIVTASMVFSGAGSANVVNAAEMDSAIYENVECENIDDARNEDGFDVAETEEASDSEIIEGLSDNDERDDTAYEDDAGIETEESEDDSIVDIGEEDTFEDELFSETDEEIIVETVSDEDLQGAVSASGICGPNATWDYDADTKTITIGGSGDMVFEYSRHEWDHDSYVIPWDENGITDIEKVIIGKNITKIDRFAFYDHQSLKSLEFEAPSKLKVIGYEAFYNTGLTQVLLPESVENIENGAFSKTKITEITIPKNIISCGGFSDIKTLRKIKIESIKWKDGGFASSGPISEVIFPEGITTLPDAFFCDSWFDPDFVLVIPNTVTWIGHEAFMWGSIEHESDEQSLKKIVFEEGSQLKFIGQWAFSINDLEMVLPDSVETIADCAFAKNSKHDTFIVPENVTFLGSDLFNGDNNEIGSLRIKCKDLPEAYYETEDTYFYPAPPEPGEEAERIFICKIGSIEFPSDAKNIPNGMFEHATLNMDTLVLPDGLEYIGANSFDLMVTSQIRSIVIPSSVKTIKYRGIALTCDDEVHYDPEKDRSDTPLLCIVEDNEYARQWVLDHEQEYNIRLYEGDTPEIDENKYHIVLKGNGGLIDDNEIANTIYSKRNDSIADADLDPDKTYQLPAKIMVRNGFTLDSWNTKADGKGKKYAKTATIKNLAKKGEVKELYAQWKPVTYKLTFDLKGGTLKNAPKNYNSRDGKTFGVPTKKGYEFDGFDIETAAGNSFTLEPIESTVDGVKKVTGYRIPAASSGKVSYGDARLIAKWRGKQYTVVTHLIFTSGREYINYWVFPCYEKLDLTRCAVYMENKYLYNTVLGITGFTTKEGGKGRKYLVNKQYAALTQTDNAEIHLYPQDVVVDGYRIIFDNVTSKYKNKKEYSRYKDNKITNPTKPGYTFTGWTVKMSTGADATETTKVMIKRDGNKVTILKGSKGNVYFTANWKPISYNVTVYDNYSGSTAGYTGVKYEDVDGTAKYRPFMNFGADEPVRAGYTFKGYNTQKNGKGKYIYPTGNAGNKYYTFEGLSTKAGSTVKLYAIWQKNK